ncbi:hypothetical protein ACJX0J_015398, partial [Zea mays]
MFVSRKMGNNYPRMQIEEKVAVKRAGQNESRHHSFQETNTSLKSHISLFFQETDVGDTFKEIDVGDTVEKDVFEKPGDSLDKSFHVCILVKYS